MNQKEIKVLQKRANAPEKVSNDVDDILSEELKNLD
jgi:hypothetical protein